MICDCGFQTSEFYYPLPDYKLPLMVCSEHYIPKEYPISANTPNYDCERYVFFNEEKTMNDLIKDGYFEDFSNSFLVFCR